MAAVTIKTIAFIDSKIFAIHEWKILMKEIPILGSGAVWFH